ncbi:hypothetical protein ACIRG5_24115 [Lentzea sp. NPDC102401]
MLGPRLVTARELGDVGDVLTAELPRAGIRTYMRRLRHWTLDHS